MTEEEQNKLAEVVYAAMVDKEITQGELAEELEVSRVTVNRWVNGRQAVSREHWAGLERVLGIKVEETVSILVAGVS